MQQDSIPRYSMKGTPFSSEQQQTSCLASSTLDTMAKFYAEDLSSLCSVLAASSTTVSVFSLLTVHGDGLWSFLVRSPRCGRIGPQREQDQHANWTFQDNVHEMSVLYRQRDPRDDQQFSLEGLDGSLCVVSFHLLDWAPVPACHKTFRSPRIKLFHFVTR